MDIDRTGIITDALRFNGLSECPRSIRVLSSGSACSVFEVELSDTMTLVAKVTHHAKSPQLEAEASGLKSLKQAGILTVPKSFASCIIDQHAVLLSHYCPPADPALVTEDVWARFGIDLAKHHKTATEQRFGWDTDNFIGDTPQKNAWNDDWVEFNQINRLGFQHDLALSNQLLVDSESMKIQHIIKKLDAFIPRQPRPSLLHGDLWSGNAIPTTTTQATKIAVIDPAVYIGDCWADIAMMKLFGGFLDECFDAFSAEIGPTEGLEARLLVYQLYHALNHLNLFGRSYASMVMTIADQLINLSD